MQYITNAVRVLPRNLQGVRHLFPKLRLKVLLSYCLVHALCVLATGIQTGSQNIIKTSNCHCNVIASMHKVCKRHVNMCNICNSNASNFRISELRALNIEYFHYVRGEANNTVAPLCYHLPSKIFLQ